MLFILCLFYKIIVFCISRYVIEPSRKIMMTKQLAAIDEIHSSLYDQ